MDGWIKSDSALFLGEVFIFKSCVQSLSLTNFFAIDALYNIIIYFTFSASLILELQFW